MAIQHHATAVIIAVLFGISPLEAVGPSDFPKTEKPVSLFNGEDLSGWNGQKEFWSVEGGTIRGANKGKVPSSTYLFTAKKYREFRMLLEVKQTRGKAFSTMHSAVAALGTVFKDKGDNAFGFKGPLLMFCNDWGVWDAYRRNRVYPAGHRGTLKNPSEKVGDWNKIEILVIGNRIRMVSNGHLIMDYVDKPEMLQASPLGLQLHSNGRPQEFHFREIYISEKPTDQLISLKKAK